MTNVNAIQKVLDKYAIMRPGLAEEIYAAIFPNSGVAYYLRDKIKPGWFNVTLLDYSRDRMITTIKAVREIAPMGLKEAKDAVDAVKMGKRVTIVAGVSADYARDAVDLLANVGGRAEAHRFYEELSPPPPKIAQPAKARRQIDITEDDSDG